MTRCILKIKYFKHVNYMFFILKISQNLYKKTIRCTKDSKHNLYNAVCRLRAKFTTSVSSSSLNIPFSLWGYTAYILYFAESAAGVTSRYPWSTKSNMFSKKALTYFLQTEPSIMFCSHTYIWEKQVLLAYSCVLIHWFGFKPVMDVVDFIWKIFFH